MEGTTAVKPVEQLEPVELYTAAALMTGGVAPNGRRMSDMLNADKELRVRGLTVTPYHTDVPVAATEADDWQSVSVDDVLLVMPPEHDSPKQMRVHRRQHRMRLRVGDFEVTGNLHLPPGTTLDAFRGRRSSAFIAVTKATAFASSNPAWERIAPVLLVNAKHVRDATDVLSIV